MICASLALLHPLLSLTHWIFRSLMLPYKSSSHSANHVRCASLRSGGRRLAVRKTIEYQIGALPRTPFPAAREFAPVGSMSLDSRVAGLPYESSSFATSRGNERYEEKNRGVICFMYYSSNPPLVAGATTLPCGKHVTGFAGRGAPSMNSVPLPPPLRGGTIKLRGSIFS